MSVLARKSVTVAVSALFVGWSASSLADSDVRLVDCAAGARIQDAVAKKNPDRPLAVVIRGSCAENVEITKDDVTLAGEGGVLNVSHNIVNGTISVLGARRVLINAVTVSSSTGNGIFGTGNASLSVVDSRVEQNLTNGLTVRDGAQAVVRSSHFLQNGHGTALRDTGRGIEAVHNGSIDVENSFIIGNRSDGILVSNGSYARLVQNTIQNNGRLAAGESGVQVNRSRVRANGNIITNNTGVSAVTVANSADYRTGTGLNGVDFPDNEFASEQIEHRVGEGCGVTPPQMLSNCLFAIDVSNASYGDFRQVEITGSILVGRQSLVQVRGDDILPRQQCSQITNTGGVIQILRNGHLRLAFTNVTNPTLITGGPGQNAQQEGALTCAVQP